MKIVLDASVAVKLFLSEDGHEAALDIFNAAQDIIAPDFILLEISNVLWKKHRKKEISLAHLHAATKNLHTRFDKLYPTHPLMEQAIELALELDHVIYDCLYLALALQQNFKLISADEKFIRKCLEAGYNAHASLLSA